MLDTRKMKSYRLQSAANCNFELDIEQKLFNILPDQTQPLPTEAVHCLTAYLTEIEKLIENVIICLKNGGQLYYVGAGSSGRIAMLDSSECPATFGCEQKIQTIMAGGSSLNEEQGFAEDCMLDGFETIQSLNVNENDFVLGITASGTTRFVWSALYAASRKNAQTSLLTFNKFIKPKFKLDSIIKVDSGPEILTGSTRLKCGNLTKIILNMISTTAMVKLGFCVSNLMVCVKPTNLKLKQRLVNILMALVETKKKEFTEDEAMKLLEKYEFNIKKVLSILKLDHQSINQFE